MSEVQSRPAAPRGRGSARGGRGGFSSRGGRGGRVHATNGDKADHIATPPIEDDGEVGQLKRLYGFKVSTIQEMFPNWTDADIVFALQETDGDLENTVGRITDGTISQWGEVSKTKKDRSRSKAKDTTTSFGDATNQSRVSRGGRAGFDSGRGGRGRGTDRGRGGKGRGAPVTLTNGSHKENVELTPVPESTLDASTTNAPASDTAAAAATLAWDTTQFTEKPVEENSWGSAAAGTATTATTSIATPASGIIPDGIKKSWASIFRPPPVPKKAPEPVEKPAEPVKEEEPIEIPSIEPKAPVSPEPDTVEPVEETPAPVTAEEPKTAITPSHDELTEDNLEQVPDVSAPAPTATAASTVASSWDDPRNTTTTSTPYSAPRGQSQAVRSLPTSGFQASALKATGSSGRTPSYQRRVLDQEEAVRMPGNREVDRAAVQFGTFNLNGSGEEDIDGDREEPETRGQPPQHSPVAPKASLPPTPAPASVPAPVAATVPAPVSAPAPAPAPQQPVAAPESFPTPKQSAGLPAAASHPTAAPGLPSLQTLPGAQNASQQAPQVNGQFNQYSRFGQSGTQEQLSLPQTQKSYDAFSQQAPSTQSPFEGYPSHQSTSQPQQQSGTFSSATSDFTSYYTGDPGQRNAYNYYSQPQYGLQQGGQGQQDGPASQQRSYSGYQVPQSEGPSGFPQSAAQSSQSRYATAGEGQTSGHTTPNPVQAQQSGASQAQPQPGHPQQPQAGNYPYGHPYFSSPYYAAYVNQYGPYGAGNGNYPAALYGVKGGLHQQAYQGYGMTGAPYEHASSPAAGGFSGASPLHGRDSAPGGGLGEYGRAGSTQSAQTPQGLASGGAFGGASHEAFGRGSSYQGQAQNQQHYSANQASQQGAGDDLKPPFGDSKTANGPSPSLSQAGRPGSATNTIPGSTLPPPQSQQGGYGGYPAHLQPSHGLHGNQAAGQYGALGAAGAHQQGTGQGHQSSQYGGYQGFGGNNYYGNSQQRGGWGGNYGH